MHRIMIIMIGIFGVLFVCAILFIIFFTFSSNFKAKLMGKNIKAAKYLLDDNKDILQELSDTSAKISENAIKTRVKAFKEGLRDETMYCKHCGEVIDSNSNFCKKCGQKQ